MHYIMKVNNGIHFLLKLKYATEHTILLNNFVHPYIDSTTVLFDYMLQSTLSFLHNDIECAKLYLAVGVYMCAFVCMYVWECMFVRGCGWVLVCKGMRACICTCVCFVFSCAGVLSWLCCCSLSSTCICSQRWMLVISFGVWFCSSTAMPESGLSQF